MPESFEGVPLDDHRAGIEGAIELLVKTRLEGGQPRRRARRPARARRAARPAGGTGRRPAALLADRGGGGHRVRPRASPPRTDADPEELFDLFQQAFGIADDAMVSVAGGHRREPSAGGPGERSPRQPGPRGPARPALRRASCTRASWPSASIRCPATRPSGRGEPDASDIDDVDSALELDPSSSERTGLAAALESELAGFSDPDAAARRAAADRDRPARCCRASCPAPTGRPAGSSPPPRASAWSECTT